MLPVVHSSAEELAEHLLNELITRFYNMFSVDYLVEERGITSIELAVSEAPQQTATCTRHIQQNKQHVNDTLVVNGTTELNGKRKRTPTPCLKPET